MIKGVGEVKYIIIDSLDNKKLATFWSSVLGLEITQRSHPYIELAPQSEGSPILSFQQVKEPKIVKNRLHLDVKVDDLQIATEQIVKLGGRLVKECYEESYNWNRMADPEDNEFCIVID